MRPPASNLARARWERHLVSHRVRSNEKAPVMPAVADQFLPPRTPFHAAKRALERSEDGRLSDLILGGQLGLKCTRPCCAKFSASSAGGSIEAASVCGLFARGGASGCADRAVPRRTSSEPFALPVLAPTRHGAFPSPPGNRVASGRSSLGPTPSGLGTIFCDSKLPAGSSISGPCPKSRRRRRSMKPSLSVRSMTRGGHRLRSELA